MFTTNSFLMAKLCWAYVLLWFDFFMQPSLSLMGAMIIEISVIIALCIAYYFLFGTVKTSKRAQIAELISLFGTVVLFGVAKNVKIWVIFIAFFLIGMMKKTTAKNERRNKRFGH